MLRLKFYIIFIFISASLISQNGEIRGRVYNELNNDPLPFSNIYIEGTDYGASSDFNGNFIIAGLKPGIYRLKVSSLGFENRYSEEIQVIAGRTINISIPMREAALTLNEVTVKAKVFTKKEEAPVSLRKLGLSEIENSPGANRDISKVIQNLPGVAAFSAQNRNDIIVRGGASNESNFYLDDIEIPTINHFSTQGASGGTNGILNADFIRDLEFYAGAFPASRGNALSGVFNFKQIDGNNQKIKTRASLVASEVSLTIDGPLTENTTFIFSAHRSYLNFLFKLIGLPFLPTFNDFQFKFKTRIDAKSEITFIGLGAYDINILDRDLKNPTEFQKYLLGYLNDSKQWNYSVGSAYKRFRDNGFTTFVLSRSMLSNSFYKYQNNIEQLENLISDYNSFEAENKFRIEDFFKTKNNFRVNYGINYEYARYYNDTYLKLFTPFGPQILTYDSNMDLFKYGAFGQVTRSFVSNRLSLSLGFRVDGTNYSKSMNNPLEQFSPRFSASYGLSDKFSLNFNTGRYFMLPSYTSLGYRNKEGVLVNKNNNIQYIQSDHLIAGISFYPNTNSILTIEGFYKSYDKYPFSVRDSLNLALKPVDFGVLGDEEILSIGLGHAYGVEILSQNRFKNDFFLNISYTFAIAEFKDKNYNYVPASWDNRHILIITSTKKFKNNWFAGIKWRYAGGLPYTAYDLETSSLIAAWDLRKRPYLDYSKLNSERFKPFHQLDIRIDKGFYFRKSELKVYIDIQNAYNQKFETQDIITNLDENGNPMYDLNNSSKYLLRNIKSEGTGTILPTIGIIYNF